MHLISLLVEGCLALSDLAQRTYVHLLVLQCTIEGTASERRPTLAVLKLLVQTPILDTHITLFEVLDGLFKPIRTVSVIVYGQHAELVHSVRDGAPRVQVEAI